MIVIVGVFTLAFYSCNRQQKRGQLVIQNRVSAFPFEVSI